MKGHEVQDANWMASVGVDYLKVDDMSGSPHTEAGAYVHASLDLHTPKWSRGMGLPSLACIGQRSPHKASDFASSSQPFTDLRHRSYRHPLVHSLCC